MPNIATEGRIRTRTPFFYNYFALTLLKKNNNFNVVEEKNYDDDDDDDDGGDDDDDDDDDDDCLDLPWPAQPGLSCCPGLSCS